MRANKVALITGASGGLGLAFAQDLARRGHDLVLTARSETTLSPIAESIREEHGVRVTIAAADLSVPRAVSDLIALLDAYAIEPSVIVNNAGFGLNQPFSTCDPEQMRAMLQLNVISLTELTKAYATRLSVGMGGHILLVASMAAYMPAPMMATYAASKSYVLSLGNALNVELRPKVGVTVLSPGYMETGFDKASGFVPSAATRRTALAPAEVATIGLDALFAGKPAVVAGKANRFGAFATRLLPAHFLARQVLRSMGGRFDAA